MISLETQRHSRLFKGWTQLISTLWAVSGAWDRENCTFLGNYLWEDGKTIIKLNIYKIAEYPVTNTGGLVVVSSRDFARCLVTLSIDVSKFSICMYVTDLFISQYSNVLWSKTDVLPSYFDEPFVCSSLSPLKYPQLDSGIWIWRTSHAPKKQVKIIKELTATNENLNAQIWQNYGKIRSKRLESVFKSYHHHHRCHH